MKKIFCLLVMLVLVIPLTSCTRGKQEVQGPKPTGQIMRIPLYYWPGMYWIDIAKQKGWFQEAGLLQIQFIDTNVDWYKAMDDMAAGKIDCYDFFLFDLVKFRLAGKNLVAVLQVDLPYGADGIAAWPGIQRVKDLMGKKVGVSPGTYMEYLLYQILKQANLQLADVTQVDTKTEDAVKDLSSAKIDATVTWEPLLTDAAKAVKGTLVADDSSIPSISPCVFVFSESFIRSRPGDVQAFVNVWHRTTQFIKEYPAEAFGIIAEIYKKTPGDVQAFAQKDKINDLRDNQTAFTYSASFESLYGAARAINTYLIDKGLTDRELDTTQFLNGHFIKSLSGKK